MEKQQCASLIHLIGAWGLPKQAGESKPELVRAAIDTLQSPSSCSRVKLSVEEEAVLCGPSTAEYDYRSGSRTFLDRRRATLGNLLGNKVIGHRGNKEEAAEQCHRSNVARSWSSDSSILRQCPIPRAFQLQLEAYSRSSDS